MSYTVEKVLQIWNDKQGTRIDVSCQPWPGQNSDSLGLLELRCVSDDGVVGSGITMPVEQALLVAKAMVEVVKDLKEKLPDKTCLGCGCNYPGGAHEPLLCGHCYNSGIRVQCGTVSIPDGYTIKKPGAAWDSWLKDHVQKVLNYQSTNRFDCEECGAGVKVDEDGCCVTCGRDCAVIEDGKVIYIPLPDKRRESSK